MTYGKRFTPWRRFISGCDCGVEIVNKCDSYFIWWLDEGKKRFMRLNFPRQINFMCLTNSVKFGTGLRAEHLEKKSSLVFNERTCHSEKGLKGFLEI